MLILRNQNRILVGLALLVVLLLAGAATAWYWLQYEGEEAPVGARLVWLQRRAGA